MAKRPADEGVLEELAAGKRRALEDAEGNPTAALPDPPDDELDDVGIPHGWRECPAVGRPVERFIPMKVPLGARYDDHIPEAQRFSVADAAAAAQRAVQGLTFDMMVEPPPDAPPGPDGSPPAPRLERLPAVVGLVIDLTRSNRYYDAQQWHDHGIRYIKIPCQGRGQPPEPAAVTDLCWEMWAYLQACPQGMALIHCTHGFNRTGYMVASYLARMLSWRVPKALDLFARRRPPGIYKHYYIRDLFRYYHERVPPNFPFPAQPAWKAGDSPEHEEGAGEGGEGEGEEEELHHDDVIGEPVDLPEVQMLQHRLMDSILGHDPDRDRVWLPGSQPVSLDATNLGLLKERRYWVTWKADGTRYMLLLLRWGTYLVDRKFAITRVQMRWPTPLQAGQQAKGPVGPMHHWTVLDGEMVVDDALEEGRQHRRFLAYDMVMLNGCPLVERPWMERFQLIQKWVVEPRALERREIERGRWQYPYQYDKEAFRVRRKDFWPLTQAHKLIHQFIPMLSHEADGLIFQGAQDPYVPGTCPELLKWKFAHMNSVDFRLRRHPAKGWLLELLETRRGEGYRRGYRELEGATVEFPEGEAPEPYDMRIIECAYDAERGVWLFMRERKDKDTPNAFHVYESVARSIQDNIREEGVLAYIEEALRLPLYNKDCGRPEVEQQGQPPPQQPPQQQQGQQPQQQDHQQQG